MLLMHCYLYTLFTAILFLLSQLLKSLETEVKVLSSLKHEHIVKFFGMEEKQKTTILLLEYMEGVRNILLFINLRDTSSILAYKD